MKEFAYDLNHSSEQVNEWRLITRSLLILALVSGIVYLRVFAVTALGTLDANGQGLLGRMVLLFLVAGVASLLAIWRWEGVGGLIAVLSGIGVTVFTFLLETDVPWLTAFFYGSPFVIVGALSLVCWWQERDRRAAANKV